MRNKKGYIKLYSIITIVLLLTSLKPSTAQLEKDAVLFESAYTADWLRNFSGGIQSGNAYLGMLDFALTLNTGRTGLWNNGQVYLQIENTHGATPSDNLTGDIQVFSNIENGDYTYLYMAYYRHQLDDLVITAGVHDLNSIFHASEVGSAFINSSFGIMPGASLNFPFSIFPKNSLALVGEYQLNNRIIVNAGIYDGDPGTLDEYPYNLDLTVNSDQGYTAIAEIHLIRKSEEGREGTYKIGTQYNSGQYVDFSNGDEKTGNFGVYAIADYMVTKDIGFFAQLSYAPEQYNVNPIYGGAGMNLFSPFSNRDDDIIGLAFAYAKMNENFNAFDLGHESVLELTYHWALSKNIVIQPDVQYIINPGATSGLDNALVGMFRFNLSY